MTSPIGSNNRGLTLIEVLVSVVILSAGAVVLTQSLAGAAHAQAVAELRMQAYLLAASKLGELELLAARGEPLSPQEEGVIRVDGQVFDWSATASPLTIDLVQTVQLRVSWRQGSRAYTQQMDTAVRLPESAREKVSAS